MYSSSAQQSREAFWKVFGQYMALVPSASGEKVNWINYKTGSKAVRFALDIQHDIAQVMVLIADEELFNKMISLKKIFSAITDQQWQWSDNKISIQLKGKDIRNKHDWPELITFFKQGLIALDVFWTEVRDIII